MYDKLEKKWNDLVEQYHIEKQNNLNLEEQLKHSIKKDMAEDL